MPFSSGGPPVSLRSQARRVTRRNRFLSLLKSLRCPQKHTCASVPRWWPQWNQQGVKWGQETPSFWQSGHRCWLQTPKALASASAVPHPPPPPAAYTPLTFHARVLNTPQYHWHHEQPPTGIYFSVFSLLGKPTANFQNTGPHSCLFTQRSKLRFSRGASTWYRDQSAVISESQQAARLSG